MDEYEIVIKSPDGGFRRVWTKTLVMENVKIENDELIIIARKEASGDDKGNMR